jgi:hypothetical protein
MSVTVFILGVLATVDHVFGPQCHLERIRRTGASANRTETPIPADSTVL